MIGIKSVTGTSANNMTPIKFVTRIADELREGQLLAVRTLPDRYAHLDPAPTRVAQINVTPINKDAAPG